MCKIRAALISLYLLVQCLPALGQGYSVSVDAAGVVRLPATFITANAFITNGAATLYMTNSGDTTTAIHMDGHANVFFSRNNGQSEIDYQGATLWFGATNNGAGHMIAQSTIPRGIAFSRGLILVFSTTTNIGAIVDNVPTTGAVLTVGTNSVIINGSVTAPSIVYSPNVVITNTAGLGGLFDDANGNTFLDMAQWPAEIDYRNNSWVFNATNNGSHWYNPAGGAVTVVQFSKNGSAAAGGSFSVTTTNFGAGSLVDTLLNNANPNFSVSTNTVTVGSDLYVNGPNGLNIPNGSVVVTNGSIIAGSSIFSAGSMFMTTGVITNKLFVDGGALLAGLTVTNGITNLSVYFGNGSGLTNIPASSLSSVPTNFPVGFQSDSGHFTNAVAIDGALVAGGSIVAQASINSAGSMFMTSGIVTNKLFVDQVIFAAGLTVTNGLTNSGVYIGNGSGLTNIPPSALSSAPTNFPVGFQSDSAHITNSMAIDGALTAGGGIIAQASINSAGSMFMTSGIVTNKAFIDGGLLSAGGTFTNGITNIGVYIGNSSSLTNSVVTKTANYTALSSDYFVNYDTVSVATAGVTNTLPSAVTATAGRSYVVKDSTGAANTKNIVINATAGNIDGASTATITTSRGSLSFYSDGSNWFVY